MAIDESLVQEIVRRILAVAKPERIILFGSAACGSMSRDSDIDLLVVEPEPHDHRQECVRIRRVLHGLGFPIDVVVVSTDWFEETKNVIGGIAYPANKYGKVIDEAAGRSETPTRGTNRSGLRNQPVAVTRKRNEGDRSCRDPREGG